MGPRPASSGRRVVIVAAAPAAHPSAPVSPSSDAGVTPWGSPVRLRSSGERLPEAVSRFCNGGFCAGSLPDPAGNKTALKVPIDAGQVSRLVAGLCCAGPGWVQARCRLLTGHGWGARPAWRFPKSSLHYYCCCVYGLCRGLRLSTGMFAARGWVKALPKPLLHCWLSGTC